MLNLCSSDKFLASSFMKEDSCSHIGFAAVATDSNGDPEASSHCNVDSSPETMRANCLDIS